jgi:hypothetical protein
LTCLYTIASLQYLLPIYIQSSTDSLRAIRSVHDRASID